MPQPHLFSGAANRGHCARSAVRMEPGILADTDARSSTQKHAAALVGLAAQVAVCGLVTAVSSQRMPRTVRAPSRISGAANRGHCAGSAVRTEPGVLADADARSSTQKHTAALVGLERRPESHELKRRGMCDGGE